MFTPAAADAAAAREVTEWALARLAGRRDILPPSAPAGPLPAIGPARYRRGGGARAVPRPRGADGDAAGPPAVPRLHPRHADRGRRAADMALSVAMIYGGSHLEGGLAPWRRRTPWCAGSRTLAGFPADRRRHVRQRRVHRQPERAGGGARRRAGGAPPPLHRRRRVGALVHGRRRAHHGLRAGHGARGRRARAPGRTRRSSRRSPASTRTRSSPWSPPPAPPTTAPSTTSPASPTCAPPTTCACTWTAPTAARRCSRRAPARCSPASSGRTRSSSTRTRCCTRRSTAPPWSTATAPRPAAP